MPDARALASCCGDACGPNQAGAAAATGTGQAGATAAAGAGAGAGAATGASGDAALAAAATSAAATMSAAPGSGGTAAAQPAPAVTTTGHGRVNLLAARLRFATLSRRPHCGRPHRALARHGGRQQQQQQQQQQHTTTTTEPSEGAATCSLMRSAAHARTRTGRQHSTPLDTPRLLCCPCGTAPVPVRLPLMDD
jgi:hypothetical protein